MTAIHREFRLMFDQLSLGEDSLKEWLRSSAQVIRSVQRIPGDASTRKYYRIFTDTRSYILMSMECFEGLDQDMSFLSVQRHLMQSQVDVPQVFDIDPKRGLVLLEDLGDVTLLRRLQEVSTSDSERHLYERVIDSLVQLQVKASSASKDSTLEAFRLRFDFEKLMWEMDFAIEHFYKTYLKRDIPDQDLRILRDELGEICQYLADQPTVLTHRDFHSRNIMVTPHSEQKLERFVMIDFQDARLGPQQYDLVSLLKDSYYQLDESQIQWLIHYYVARYEALSGTRVDQEHFMRVFDLMSVQRNFKAIGSFASFYNKRGNPVYLKYIGNTFENIRRSLLKYPKYSALRETLFYYYYF